MSIQITSHGHACFSLRSEVAHVLIDPFLDGNPTAEITSQEISPDYILVSHAHSDHLGDAEKIAKRTGCLVISNNEIHRYLSARGVKTHGMHIGGAHVFPFGKVKLTIAHHGSSFPDGSYGGSPCGFLVWMEDKVLYHAGDTALTRDMTLYGAEGIDAAMLPMGDNFTMGPEDVVKAVEFLQPKATILMHYGTFPVIVQDAAAVARSISDQTKTKPVLLRPGETWVVP